MKALSKHRIKTFVWLVLLTVLTGVTLTAARFQADDVIKGVEAEVVTTSSCRRSLSKW